MQFVHPAYLYGLLLIAIPILIHLFKLRRYTTVYFSNLKFLQDIKESDRNRSRLKDLLLLLIRILFIAAVVLAFAQPYRNNDRMADAVRHDQTVGIFIDASLSMKNLGSEETLFDQAKRMAIEKIEAYPLSTGFYLISESNSPGTTTLLDKFEAIDQIARIKLSASAPNLIQGMGMLQSLPDRVNHPASINTVLVFSDFQEALFDDEQLQKSVLPELILLPQYPQNKQNVFIDTCWLNQPVHHYGSRIQISGYIQNMGEQGYQQYPVDLYVNDSLRSRINLSLPSDSRKAFSISYLPTENGIQKGELRINDYPVDYDNKFFFSYRLNQKTRVCQLYEDEPNMFLTAALEEDTAFVYSEYPITAFPDNDFDDFETVILSNGKIISKNLAQSLEDFVKNGGNLLVFPHPSGQVADLNILIQRFRTPTLGGRIANEDISRFPEEMTDFHEEISLNPQGQISWPFLKNYHRLTAGRSPYKVILETGSGRPVWISAKYHSGIFSLATFPLNLDNTSLPEHPIFIPLIYYLSTAELRNPQIYHRMNSTLPYVLRLDEISRKPIELFKQASDFRVIPQQEFSSGDPDIRIFLNDWKGSAGFLMAGFGENIQDAVAINIPIQESKLDYYSNQQLMQFAAENEMIRLDQEPISNEPSSKLATPQSKPMDLPLTKLLLMIALVLLFAETILFRLKS